MLWWRDIETWVIKTQGKVCSFTDFFCFIFHFLISDFFCFELIYSVMSVLIMYEISSIYESFPAAVVIMLGCPAAMNLATMNMSLLVFVNRSSCLRNRCRFSSADAG